MSTSDIHSHKEEKRGPSAIKQSVMENEEEKREPGNSSIDELATKISELNIKRTSDRKETEVKFLINVPMEVTPEMSTSSESHCQKFLDLLNHKAFRKEDELRYKDIAVIFGLNGMEPDVRKEMKKNVEIQCRVDRKALDEERGEQNQQRTTSWDSNSGRRERSCTVCQRTNRKAIGTDGS
ncbi:hypothetical protein G5714_004707 [Onychostoma macrolepis]|uniref:Uncharacterized protein n=1 Tax=Onychostoma macrolepis TaxID=369639 RepID=A0A7J6D676_9TELE|nr:hypothetical protein G5714_004707 [Onychostoma macrolepis]